MVHQARPTWNRRNKNSANLAAVMAMFGTAMSSTPTCPFLPTLLVDLWCRCSSQPCTTAWQTEEENSCLHNTHCWVAKGLSTEIADPSVPGLPRHPHDEIFYDGALQRNVWQHVENYGEPRSLHPTWCHQNQLSELTFDMFYQKLGQNQIN